MIPRPLPLWKVAASVLLAASAQIACAEVAAPPTMLESQTLDAAHFSQWVDGAETPIAAGDPSKRESAPQWVVWTKTTQPGHSGMAFGESKTPGVRHLRIGFTAAIPVGTVMVKGGGALSFLKTNASAPGDLADESAWQPAQRIDGAKIDSDPVDARGEFAFWILPPGTTSRALRFTHIAAASDKDYAGWLGGALLLAERVVNVAPQAIASASSRKDSAALLNDASDNELWKAWDNGKNGGEQIVSAERPEWITLVWPRAVTLRALNAVWAGFSACDVQSFKGPDSRHPREAAESDWEAVVASDKIEHQYPRTLGVNWLDFGRTITTRAVRLRITRAAQNTTGHLEGKTAGGKRVWLGELMAIQSLGSAEAATALISQPVTVAPPPPIPVRFTLAEPGYVTLVIEKPNGVRVRNLVSETLFPAGENVAAWDGTDDLLRDKDAASHGIYHIPAQFVEPGEYRVRGIVRKALDLRYEFSIYNSGSPAWETADKTGGWLTNHTPPQAALFVPAENAPGGKPLVYLGSAVSEGGAGLAWVGLDGKKVGGRGWVGGNWTAAPYLARDAGKNAVPQVFAYVGATWTSSAKNEDKTHGELRLTALTAGGDKAVLKYPFTPPIKSQSGSAGDDDWIGQLGGIAARDGLLVASFPRLGSLLFVDARAGKALGESPVEAPRGVAFDAKGRLLVLSQKTLRRFDLNAAQPAKLPAGETLIATGLEDPRGITLDSTGRIFISDQGDSQQVKVFSPEGKFLRAIGHPGAPKPGLYDPLHMNHPHGLAVDSEEHLWVTENDFQPKRVSVWTLDGQFVRASYGPGRYGGGGTLDPRDPTRFYYDGIEFKLDWKSGTDAPAAIFYREGQDDLNSGSRAGAPETPIHLDGRQYMTNCHDSNPTGGASVASLWLMKDHLAKPVAALGRAADWKILQTAEFKSAWPAGTDDAARRDAIFAWSDLDGDGHAQPAEVQISKAKTGGVTVMPDLSLVESRVDDRAVRFAPTRFTPAGAPVYDLAAGETVVAGAQAPASSGGDQVLIAPDGWSVQTVAPQPFAPQSMGGAFRGEPRWSYPSVWPGLHASHEAPLPDRPGQLIGTTRLLGGFVTPRGSDAGPLWAINGNMGTIYLFTADGLFVATLFHDERRGTSWAMPSAPRGMSLNALTVHGENFWPSITQTADGAVFLCDGARTSLVRIDGLDTLRRLPDSMLKITPQDLQKAQSAFVESEAARQKSRGSETLEIPFLKTAPQVDGKLDDWAGAHWVDVDKSGAAAWFDSDSKPHDVTAALAVSGDRLYAAFRTDDAALLRNSGEVPNALFKTGGALDIMIGTDPAADPARSRPVVGDARLLITQVSGRTLALLYRAVVPGTKEPVPFSSPWRTITLDRVEDVSAQVTLATTSTKNARGKTDTAFYEISIPLATLGLAPRPGQSISGDIGILRGDGIRTMQRVYWSNKATGITEDVPSEAELVPKLWGRWRFTP